MIKNNSPHYRPACLLVGLLLLASGTTPVRAADFGGLGFFVGGKDAQPDFTGHCAEFVQGVGQRATLVNQFIDYKQGISHWVSSANYNISQYNSSPELAGMIPLVSVGLADYPTAFPSDVYNRSAALAMMNAVAAGTHDAVFNGIINAYKNAGFPKIYLRPGWEMNGSWEPWYATKDSTMAAAYNAAFQRVANLAHNAAGITIKIVWSPSIMNISGATTITAYPGDAYVDVIAPDFYNKVSPSDLKNWDGTGGFAANQTAWAASALNREHYWDYPAATQYQPTAGFGMVYAMQFALDHNKPFGLSECGSGGHRPPPDGSGTQPQYGPLDCGNLPTYLANRLAAKIAAGLKFEFILVWDMQEWNFGDGKYQPKDAAAWTQFVNAMAGDAPAVEAEAISGSTGSDTRSVVSEVGATGGNVHRLQANLAGDYVQYPVSITVPGTYSIKVRVKKSAGNGIFQLAIDGTNQAAAQDLYRSADIYQTVDLGFKTFSTTGTKTFKFSVSGKNTSSTGYVLDIDSFDVSPRLLEAESILDATASDTVTLFSDGVASRGSAEKLESNAVNDFIQYMVPVINPGTYSIKVRVKKHNARGKFQLTIDGASQGAVQDQYTAASDPNPYVILDLGTKAFTTVGNKVFKFTVTGKNASSIGYALAFDTIELQ